MQTCRIIELSEYRAVGLSIRARTNSFIVCLLTFTPRICWNLPVSSEKYLSDDEERGEIKVLLKNVYKPI